MTETNEPEIATEFNDTLDDVHNGMINQRNKINTSRFAHRRIDEEQLRAMNLTGIGSKIVRIKAGYSLKDTIQFNNPSDEEYYNKRLRKEVKRATRFMIGYGRGIVVNYYKGDDLGKPFVKNPNRKLNSRAFSGDEVTTSGVYTDLYSPRYRRPENFNVNGHNIHCSRVIEFNYYEPPEDFLEDFKYGGVSEFDLIHDQMVADGVIERVAPNIVDKNSSMFYKVAGFKQQMQLGKSDDMLNYFRRVEDFRSVFGATLIDAEDQVEVHAQSLNNLNDVSDITLRRLAMVTGIPVSVLVGENVKGLNSTGDNERKVFQDMIETLQSDYILEPLQELMAMHDRGVVKFKENQGDSPEARIEYETKAIANAKVLFEIGEDHGKYLQERGIIEEEDNFFNPVMDDESEKAALNNEQAPNE